MLKVYCFQWNKASTKHNALFGHCVEAGVALEGSEEIRHTKGADGRASDSFLPIVGQSASYAKHISADKLLIVAVSCAPLGAIRKSGPHIKQVSTEIWNLSNQKY